MLYNIGKYFIGRRGMFTFVNTTSKLTSMGARLTFFPAILAAAVSIAAAGNGNTLTPRLNMPRGGDVLQRLTADPMPAGESGEGVFWDFSQLQETGTSERKWISVGDTVFAAIEEGTMYKFRFRGDSLISTGQENRTAVFRDSVPYPERIFPVVYGQSHSGCFRFTGRYAQDRDAETGGTVTVHADATGSMLLPSLDTVGDVLRVRTETRAWIRLLRHGEAVGDSIPADTLPSYVKTVYEWYAPGYRYPLVETRLYRLYENGTDLGGYGTTYYYPAIEQEYLAADPANREIREKAFLEKRGLRADTGSGRGGTDSGTAQDGGRGTVGGVTAAVSQSAVTVSFSVSGGETTIGMTLADLYGRVYGYIPEHTVGGGSHTETIDISGLMPGDYMLTVFADGAKLDEIILNH